MDHHRSTERERESERERERERDVYNKSKVLKVSTGFQLVSCSLFCLCVNEWTNVTQTHARLSKSFVPTALRQYNETHNGRLARTRYLTSCTFTAFAFD